MRIAGIIPSRYHSSRLPGKALEMIGDTSLVMRVYQQCLKAAGLDFLAVATDDKRIYEHVKQNGGEVFMTSPEHETGTERCNEVREVIREKFDFIINIQGDEPFIMPDQLSRLIDSLDLDTEIATLCKKIEDLGELEDVNTVKIAIGADGRALYFSRAEIPFVRDVKRSSWIDREVHFKHIGIYAYRSDILATICRLKPSMVEKAEQLEQLRWLSNGFSIHTVRTSFDTISVDTADDLKRARAYATEN